MRFDCAVAIPRDEPAWASITWMPFDADAFVPFQTGMIGLAELKSHAAAAREAAEGEKREMDAWASASAAGTVAALEDFRQDWPNGKYANAAHTRIREIKGGPSRRRLLGVGAGAAALGGLAVFGFRPGNLFWRLLYDQSIRTFAGHADAVRSVAFSPDGRNAQSGSNDHTVRLWDVATGEGIRTFAGDGIVTSVAFSPDGRTALSGSLDKTLKLWDAATGKEIRAFAGHAKYVVSVAFSPDGRNALSGSDDTTLKLWDVATGKEIRTFTGHTGGVSSVAFSPDGRTALSGSFDTTLRLWDLATGKEIRTFAGHTNWVFSVAFSPDGRSELSGSEDHTLKLWDVATGNNIRTFTGHTGGVSSVAFSPDGRSALSGSWDQTLKLWDLTGR